MTKHKHIKLIERAYYDLEGIKVFQITYRNPLKDLLKAAIREAKNHNNYMQNGFPDYKPKLTPTQEAKYFVCKRIVDYFIRPDYMPEVKDYNTAKASAFMAAALVLNYREALAPWVLIPAVDEISAIAYENLID